MQIPILELKLILNSRWGECYEDYMEKILY